jgi:biotin transport system substrate-specific component
MGKPPRRIRIITYTAACTGLIAAGGWASVPFIPVPFTLQTLAVMIAGPVMKRYAVLPAGLYVLLGFFGLPVFHNGTAGPGVLLGPTGGYLLGFVPAALIVGLAYEQDHILGKVAGLLGAILTIYGCGVAWLALSSGLTLPAAVLYGALPFIPGDAVKCAAAYGIGERVRKAGIGVRIVHHD